MTTAVEPVNKIVIDYLISHFDHFKNNLEKSRIEFDVEAIHQYRVSVKRIRSIFRAINKIYPGNILSDDLLSPLQEIFKAGGSIRDEQVQLELVRVLEKEYGMSFPLITDHFLRRIDSRINEFEIRSHFFDMDALIDFPAKASNALIKLSAGDMQSRIYTYIEQAVDKLKRSRHRATDPYRLHRFRMRFKQLSYIIEMIYGSNLEPNIDKKNYQKFKSLGQQLGDWHDYFQLWSRAGDFFRSTMDIHLLEESFELKKLLTPLHEKSFHTMQDELKQDKLFIVHFT
jgi:CHAD domain-containing protein